MEWTRTMNDYCERTDPSYWSEPVNAVTNAAFLIAAAIMWRRAEGLISVRVLSAILFSIGFGSYLFHTHANAWSELADVVPILLFVVAFIFLANRYLLGTHPALAVVLTAAFIPFSIALDKAFDLLPFFHISSFYWPLPVLIFSYAAFLRSRSPNTAKGLAIGGGLLCLSLTARSLDMPLCDCFPLGTHFLWHCLNGLMLGWMIEVLRRHLLEAQATQG